MRVKLNSLAVLMGKRQGVDIVVSWVRILLADNPVFSDRGSLAMTVSVGSTVARMIQRPADAVGDQPSVPSLRLRRIPPIFPADKWNVHDTTVSGADRTNNFSGAWNNGFRQLVGHNQPGVYRSVVFLSGSVGRGHPTLAASPRTAAFEARPSLHLAAAGEATEAVRQHS